jgi:two-component system, OmpR family, phosphate regulon sensor histidine kinase PhoR
MLETLVVVLALTSGVLGYLLVYQYSESLKKSALPPQPAPALQSELEKQLTESTAQVGELKTNIAKADDIILKLRRALAENDTRITDLHKQIEHSNSIVANLRGQITTSEIGTVESKALYTTIANVAYDLVFVLNEEGIIIATNKAADGLFSHANPIGEKLCDVIPSPELADIVDRAQDEDEDLEEQLTIDSMYYRARTRVTQYEGGHTFTGVALQDITQLVRLNRARRDMVANISHELRTPIANIRMIIEGLFYEAERPKRKASISTLRAISRETDSLLWLVQELLDLSMIESGQAIMKLLPCGLLDLVNDAGERLKDQMGRKDLKVVVHIPPKIQVLCDWEQTRRVLINLVHNAIKWSPDGGAITISASYQDDDVLISVFDNGPGVPDDQRERIFERFYQVDTSRSGSQGGSGLGLAICKHIVEAHGGKIWAAGNSLGGGGRFFFTLLAAVEGDYKPLPEMQRGQHDFLPLPSLPNTTPMQLADETHDDVTFELVDDENITSANDTPVHS